MGGIVVIDAFFGDCGKGRCVSYLSNRYNAAAVVRYSGGCNSGHTIYSPSGKKVVLHHIPCGIFNKKARLVLSPGMAVNPYILAREILNLRQAGYLEGYRLLIDPGVHVITQYHILEDEERERASGSAIGTTKQGIGPCYEARARRDGIRFVDILENPRLIGPDGEWVMEEILRNAVVGDTAFYLRELVQWRTVIFEGAQGTFLDNNFGDYPFVTSSSTLASAASVYTGVPMKFFNEIIGVTKAYTTRVGNGPFRGEIRNAIEAESLRKAGSEYGATTGRPRRVGYLYLPQLAEAVKINGVDSLFVTKLDVLQGRQLKYYRQDGELTFLPSFTEDLSKLRYVSQLPWAVRNYLRVVSAGAGCRISAVSVGPENHQTVEVPDGMQL